MADGYIRRRKTAAERREQRQRSDGRFVVRLLRSLDGVAAHRGNSLGRVGLAMQQALGSVVGSGSVRSPSLPPAAHARNAPNGTVAELVVQYGGGITASPARTALAGDRASGGEKAP